MISTRDEIMIALAGIFDTIPPPPIPVFDKPEEPQETEEDSDKWKNTNEELKRIEEEERQQDVPLPIPERQQSAPTLSPLPIPLPDAFVSAPKSIEAWQEPGVGTAAWVAEHHPYSYLFGHKPFMKFTNSEENDPITQKLMLNIVTQRPEKYFEWGLYRIKNNLARLDTNWGREAARTLVDKDPHYAMILGIYDNDYDIQKDPEILPKLWANIVNEEFTRSSKTATGNLFPGVLFDRARGLIKVLKNNHPDFYEANVKENMLAQKIESGKRFDTKETQRSPISVRERGFPWAEPEPGTPEWLAENYPHTYLRGQDTLSKGYVRELQEPDVIEPLMDKLVAENPIKYFEWNLRRVGDKGGYIKLKNWLAPASKSLIEKNPYAALVFARVYQYRETEKYLPELWDRLSDLEQGRKESRRDEISRHMRSLAGVLSKSDPGFYLGNIKGTRYATDEFDGRAIQMIRA